MRMPSISSRLQIRWGVPVGGAVRRTRTTAVMVGLALLAVIGVQAASSHAAMALGPGRACVFYYPFGSGGEIGHTAWAFSVPGSSVWDYGSADNDKGETAHGFDPAPINQGVWVISATYGFADVVSTFRARAYTAYTCRNTPSSAVGAAQNKAFADRDWSFLGNNCAQHVNDILSTYFGSTFSIPYGSTWDTLTPQDWFNSLYQQQGFDYPTPLWAPSGFKGGTVKTDGLNMRDAGQRGPVSFSSPVKRQTSLGTQLVIVCWMDGPSVTATWGGATYSTTTWDAVVMSNAGSLNDGTPRLAVSDAWIDTGGATEKMIAHC